ESVVILKTMAARCVVQFALEVGLLNAVFEGDSETSIKAIRNQTSMHSSFDHIIRDIWSYISSF
ncbi:reverse transcriptase-like protein, partial [Salmonella enterica]|nr:reverse transcriptase-like protein [Salmonella enterica]